MQPQEQLIVALDVPTADEALVLVNRLGDTIQWYKVGLELYLAEGSAFVHGLKQRGKHVFLDLKLHDIPNTVGAATRVAAATGADLLTVHAAGGSSMLHASLQAAKGTSLRILAVTVLTSMSAAGLNDIGVSDEPASQVLRLGQLALHLGVDGLVCSPLEVASLRHTHGPVPLLVVPGIRGPGDDSGDQQRTASARDAVRDGASMLVVGRPITGAADPRAVAQRLLREIASAQHA